MPGYWGSGPNGERVWRDFDFRPDPNDRASVEPERSGIPQGAPPPSAPPISFTAPGSGAAAPGGSQMPTFQTANGPRTPQQMMAELVAVGWGGPAPGDDVVTAYARTTGQAVTPTSINTSAGITAGTPATPIGTGATATPGTVAASPAATGDGAFPYGEYFSQQAEALKLQAAKEAADQAYRQRRMELIDQPGLQLQKDQEARLAAQTAAASVLARDSFEFSKGMSALNLMSTLRGPENAFRQQAVSQGLNAQGLSRSVDAIAGQYAPAFKAPQAAARPMTLSSLAEQIKAGGTSVSPATREQYIQALPALNQVSRNYLDLDPDSQGFIKGLYQEAGYSGNDFDSWFKNSLPKFVAPQFGAVRS